MVKKKEIFIFILLLFVGIIFVYIYSHIHKSAESLFTRIENNKIEQISYVLKNLEEDIVNTNNIKTPDDLVSLFSNKSIREDYEHTISLMLTSNVKYAYILHKDKKNKFRFLLDASKVDKASFYQKFDVFDDEYGNIYKNKKPLVIKQNDIENLYLTYLYPIKSAGNVVGIFNIDVTTNIKKIILELIKPLEYLFAFLIFLISLILVMAIMQITNYFITKRKIFTDALTGLYNRNYLQEIIPRTNFHHYSVALLDLDRFKPMNDAYGHKAGDFLLHEASLIFKKSIRENDILMRYGGGEFLLLINNQNTKETTLDVCERIRQNIENKIFVFEDNEIRLTVSIGLHQDPAFEKNIQEAIKKADKMLYIAKMDGRNKVVSYNEASHPCIASSKGINFVKKALEDNRIVCHYQPIYNYKTNEIYKYEALVRIKDEDGKIISPIEFLPFLKHTNMHYKLTQRILSIVFEKFKDNDKLVSININFSDLINSDIERTIIDTLEKNHDLASRVTFEILESDEIYNIELFKTKIKLLHSLKVKVSIDDFGSGYSNFKTTLDIEANYLKIDGSLIENIDNNEKDYKVVKSIIHFAKQSNMQTIAEFVHSKKVYDKLLLLDIDYLQGYYISQPKETLIDFEELFQ